jgi:hypothetical protein
MAPFLFRNELATIDALNLQPPARIEAPDWVIL